VHHVAASSHNYQLLERLLKKHPPPPEATPGGGLAVPARFGRIVTSEIDAPIIIALVGLVNLE
jgi:hypothetical protein